MSNVLEPKLAPPGAGIPKLELFISRIIIARLRRKATREGVNARFQKERADIRALVCSINEDTAAQRVLIKRVTGMEDSSRYWSVWMTLDHLRLVHEMVRGIIDALARGVVPAGKVNTANVKPRPSASSAVVADYEKSCDDLLATAAAASSLKTRVCHLHPWFGPLDAAGWHMLAAGHLGIHRTQIERIIQGLSAAKA